MTQHRLGNHDAGLLLLRQALQISPECATHQFQAGCILERLGRASEALECYTSTLALAPGHAEAQSRRCGLLWELQRYPEALAAGNAAIALDPTAANAHNNRGLVLRSLRQLDEALASFDRAITLNPKWAPAYINRGNVQQELGMIEAAQSSLELAARIDPTNPAVHIAKGVALQEMGRTQAAIESYNEAMVVAPDNADARFFKATALLASGQYEKGWELYEWRWKRATLSMPALTMPRWFGDEPVNGKTVLLHAEQGFGDTIQFCRYARLVQERGAKVILGVQAPLKSLLLNLEGVSHVIGPGEHLAEPVDFHCPLMSLPWAFGTTLSSIPAAPLYIKADGKKVNAWSRKLGARLLPRVGLIWSGGSRPERPDLLDVFERRNVSFDLFSQSLPTDIAEYHSLQKGEPAESELVYHRTTGRNAPEIIDHASSLNDFSDTAALIANLDLVISVDTAAAHLAAAMGKPVWILNRFDSCWRWLLDTPHSPWYPSVRLYRQEQYNQWQNVVAKMAMDLQNFCADKA